MPAEIGVFIVHGMGSQTSTFADETIRELEIRLAKLDVTPGTVAWQRGYWADLLNEKQHDLWERLRKDNDLDYAKLRRFFLDAFADAVAYRRTEGEQGGVYAQIHSRIHEHLRALRALLGGVDRPLVVLAHSLGSVIVSDYRWNAQSENALERGGTPFERMETLCGLVTFGSNIPLFTLALPKVDAITFPPKEVQEPLRSAARWLNFYDPDDVLGWPLKPLSASYAAAVHADRAINVGGIVSSWNPASHSDYWTDNDFTEPVATLIRDLRAASRATPVPVALPPGAGPKRPKPARPARRTNNG